MMLFNKSNYIPMLVGIALIIIGFALMTGGGFELNENFIQEEFDAEGLYSFRRITLAPIVIFIGFLVEIYAIMKKPNSSASITQEK
tara:strand:+ start:107 stop:364 length:258 start_codon:yes stop_codon:yes gene_type:complete